MRPVDCRRLHASRTPNRDRSDWAHDASESDGHRTAAGDRKPRGRLPRRPRHFAPYRFARFIVVVLALIGVVAVALLVLGLLDVELVSDHFSIHYEGLANRLAKPSISTTLCSMDRSDEPDRDAQTEDHQAAAVEHEDTAERLYARGQDARAVEERALARGERETAGIAAERAQLSRERARSAESPDELGEDRKAGAEPEPEPEPIPAPDAER